MRRSIKSLHPTALLLFTIVVAVLLSSNRAAYGGTREDAGFWFMLMMEGSIGSQEQRPSRFRWWLDIQPRFVEDVSGLHQGLLRPGVGYVLGTQTTAWLGYARVRTTSRSGATSNEDRIWQQLWWKPRVGAVAFQSRTRLEQRFLDTGSGTGWRFRQFVKASWDLPGTSRLSLAGYDEVFIDLNDTGWGQRSGFSQNRLFAGLGVKLGERGRTKLEAGYLNQFINRSGTDTMNHILSINLFMTF